MTSDVRCVVDPCAGTGAILDVVRNYHVGVATVGADIDPDRARVAARRHDVGCYDFLTTYTDWGPGTIMITNPPYAIAEAFLLKCFEGVATVAALLRLAFVETRKRAAFWREHPADIYVLSRRPSFTGRGTDSCAYAWFVWGPGLGAQRVRRRLPVARDASW